MLFPAKILLFGEHTVLYGGRALAVPFPRFNLRWVQGESADEHLAAFADWLDAGLEWLDVSALRQAIRQDNWQLSGDIPMGYGLGSSGAVCAAVYYRFSRGTAVSLSELRPRLSQLENYFHGHSSGLDPLVSLCRCPLLVSPEGSRQASVLQAPLSRLFLVDTGQPRSDSQIVNTLKQQYQTDANWRQVVHQQWTIPSERLIDAMQQPGDASVFFQTFAGLSRFQLSKLSDYIPREWHERFIGDNYCLKICGAGGGGFLIGCLQEGHSHPAGLDPAHLYRLHGSE